MDLFIIQQQHIITEHIIFVLVDIILLVVVADAVVVMDSGHMRHQCVNVWWEYMYQYMYVHVVPFIAKLCPDPTVPSHGRINITAPSVGGVATYSCEEGYRLMGTATRTCLTSAQWSGSPPSCIGKKLEY